MFSAEIIKKNLQKFLKKILQNLKIIFLKIQTFFNELPSKLKQFSLLDFSKNIFEIIQRKISEIIYKIKNSSREEKKEFVVNTSKYVFSKKFVISHNFASVLIFLLTLSSIYFYFSKFHVAEALFNEKFDPWYSDSWNSRVSVVVSNGSATTISNYISDSSLPGSILFSSGMIKSDCADIRVVEATSQTVMDAWIDPDSCTSPRANIYFKIPTLTASTEQKYYIYYGNSSATMLTVASSTLFSSTIPKLVLNYSFDDISSNLVYNPADPTPYGSNYGGVGYNAGTFPEGYSGKAMYFDGIRQFVSTPYTFSRDLSRAYTMIAAIKPEGTIATGYTVVAETTFKFLSFEDFGEGTSSGSTNCVTWENVLGDVVDCTSNTGVRQITPPNSSVKKTGVLNYLFDAYGYAYSRPSRALSITGPSYYFYQDNPVNFLGTPTVGTDAFMMLRVKLYGSAGDRRTIISYGNTAASANFALDYYVCDDETLNFIIDYKNSTNDSATLATGCLRYFQPSMNVSTYAAMSIAANSNHWIQLFTGQVDNKRVIAVNGAIVKSDATADISIARSNLYLGKASNVNKSNFYGEIDEWVTYGEFVGM